MSSRNVRSYTALTKISGDLRAKAGSAQLANRDRPRLVCDPAADSFREDQSRCSPALTVCRMSGCPDPHQARPMFYGRPFRKHLRGISSMTGYNRHAELKYRAVATGSSLGSAPSPNHPIASSSRFACLGTKNERRLAVLPIRRIYPVRMLVIASLDLLLACNDPVRVVSFEADPAGTFVFTAQTNTVMTENDDGAAEQIRRDWLADELDARGMCAA